MEAKIFFGSNEEGREEVIKRESPYDGSVVSTAPICSAEDANKALQIAQKASKTAKKNNIGSKSRVAFGCC